MNIEIRYFTKTGNTQKLANAIGNALFVEAKDCSFGLSNEADILFIGGSIYANKVAAPLKSFIDNLDPLLLNQVVVFATSASKKHPANKIIKLLRKRNIKVLDEVFECKGKFWRFHVQRPDENDLENIRNFALKIVDKVKAGD